MESNETMHFFDLGVKIRDLTQAKHTVRSVAQLECKKSQNTFRPPRPSLTCHPLLSFYIGRTLEINAQSMMFRLPTLPNWVIMLFFSNWCFSQQVLVPDAYCFRAKWHETIYHRPNVILEDDPLILDIANFSKVKLFQTSFSMDHRIELISLSLPVNQLLQAFSCIESLKVVIITHFSRMVEHTWVQVPSRTHKKK